MSTLPITGPQPKSGIMDIHAYVPGKSGPKTGKTFKLSSNESAVGASPKAIAAFEAAAGELALYPDGSAAPLREAIAKKFKSTLTRHDRYRISHRAAELIRERSAEISDLITAESGLCKKDSLYEVGRACDVFTFAGNALPTVEATSKSPPFYNTAGDVVTVPIGYLKQEVKRPIPLSRLNVEPEDLGIAGAEIARRRCLSYAVAVRFQITTPGDATCDRNCPWAPARCCRQGQTAGPPHPHRF